MKNKKKIFFSFVIVTIFLLIGFFLINHSVKKPILSTPANIKYLEIGGQRVKVDLALTSAEHTQGLSGRKELTLNEGMLFVFNKPDKYLFWMKDMNFPIDIIWISEDMRIVYIKKDARPELYPETYGPNVDAKYVLEVMNGFSDINNLREGDSVKFIY